MTDFYKILFATFPNFRTGHELAEEERINRYCRRCRKRLDKYA